MTFRVSECYADRLTRFAGLHTHDGWRLKVCDVIYGAAPLDEAAYEDALPLIHDALPAPASGPHRPGVGFIIRHQGRGVHYLVLAWWDNENELPMRVWVRPMNGAKPWRPASGGESICVWDLRIIEYERRAFVTHVLGQPAAPDLEAYLARGFSSDPSPT